MSDQPDSFLQVTTAAGYAANEFSIGYGGGITPTATLSPWYGKGVQGTPGAIPMRLHRIIVFTAPDAKITLTLKDIGRATGTPGALWAKTIGIEITDRVLNFGPGFVIPQGIAWRLADAGTQIGLLRFVLSVEPGPNPLR